jgi:hypothetical protein
MGTNIVCEMMKYNELYYLSTRQKNVFYQKKALSYNFGTILVVIVSNLISFKTQF